MIVIEKNEGRKIPYEVDGTKICFDDDITINLAKRQKEQNVHIDICYDVNRALVVGAATGYSYVAELDIPCEEYDEIDETATERPIDMDAVTLTLWAIE